MVMVATRSMPPAGGGACILVVEDEPLLLDELSTAVADSGFPIRVAKDAEEALAQLAVTPDIAVVLTDIRMPGLSGIALAEQILGAPATRPAVEVVLLTGEASLDDATRAIRAGAFDLLLKSMPLPELVAVVGRALVRALERRSAARMAEQQRIALQALFDTAPIGLGLIGRDLRIDRANPALVRLLRLAEGAGIGTLWETLPAAREALEAPLLRILAGGDAPASGVRLEFRDLSAPAAEAHRVLNLRLYGVPDADGSGQAFAAGLVCQDVTAETTLVRELDHRVKNAFASCLGLVQVAARTATELETRAMAKDLGQRINALSRAHDLVRPQISGASRLGLPQRVEFVALARLILAAHMSEAPQRITLRGPPTMIGPQTAPGMALLLHELATNALKYGALSVAGGAVVLDWVIDGPLFRLEWSEVGGPPLAGPPARSGFGSRLLRQPDLGALRRGAVLDWGDPTGLHARLAAPVSDLAN